MEQAEDIKLSVYRDMRDQIGAGATAGGVVAQSAFTQFFGEFLSEKVNYIESLSSAYFHKKWKSAFVRVDAYHLDEQTYDLTLVVSDFSIADTPENVGLVDVRKYFEQVRRFFRACGTADFRSAIEDSEEIVPLVHLIRDNIKFITRVRYILITNKTLGSRVKDSAFDDLRKGDGTVESEFTIWDFQRYYDAVTSMNPASEIEVDCAEYSDEGKGLPFLTSPNVGLRIGTENDYEYKAYLLMVPGRCIYEWYARYADRLLEQNVRTFLQFRGKVNRGIRQTLNSEPSRFLAYNNGLTATAEAIEFDKTGRYIVGIKNLQIVNGGQTTASIYSACKNCEDPRLEMISVQMKLIVASGSHVESLVGNISRYANSQNKIKDTDFASNQRFMLRMEGFSRRFTANPGGTLHGTRWFFERTRGQYLNTINLAKSECERNKFRQMYPKDQVFTKSDIAKYVLSWDWAPWIVAKGAENAFAEFEKRRFGSDHDSLPGGEHVRAWKFKDAEGNPQFSEYYYKELIGKAILFKQLDKALRKCDWCVGYRSPILSYSLALLHYVVYNSKKAFNFIPLWSEQKVPIYLLDYLVSTAYQIKKVFLDNFKGQNISEWAHKEVWDAIKSSFRHEELPAQIMNSNLIVPVEIIRNARERSEELQIEENERAFLKLVLSVEDRVWEELKRWLNGQGRNLKTSNIQQEALRTRVNCKAYLDEKLAKKLVLLWQQASKEGFPYPPTGDAE